MHVIDVIIAATATCIFGRMADEIALLIFPSSRASNVSPGVRLMEYSHVCYQVLLFSPEQTSSVPHVHRNAQNATPVDLANSQGECTPQWRVQNRFPHEYRVFPTRDHPRLLASIPPADVFPPQLERYFRCVVRQDADFLEAT